MTAAGEIVRGPRAIDVLREQIAPRASDQELAYLAQVSQRLALDPIAGHIVLIPRWDGRLGREVHRPQITADGRLVLADRTGELDGFDGPEWTGPRNEDATHTWYDVWDSDEKPHAARVIVHRRGRSHPTNGTVRWAEFAQSDSKGKLLPTWAQMPSHMLGKVALSLGLRRAFPGIIPVDLDLDDDFIPVEDHRPADGAGSNRERVPETTPAPPLPPPPPPAMLPGADALERRLHESPESIRLLFRAWRRSRGFRWPPDTLEELTEMAGALEWFEEEAAADQDTYGEEGGY